MEKIYVNGNEMQSLDVPCRATWQVLLHSASIKKFGSDLMNALDIVTDATMTNYAISATTCKVVPCINGACTCCATNIQIMLHYSLQFWTKNKKFRKMF